MSLDYRDELRKVLYSALLTNFPNEYDGDFDTDTDIWFENQKYTPPLERPYLAAYIYYVSGERASIGTSKRFQRHEGFFCIEVIVPEDTGMSTLWKMSTAVERAVREQQVALADGSYVTINAAKVLRNIHQDSKYYVTVMIPFCLDVCV